MVLVYLFDCFGDVGCVGYVQLQGFDWQVFSLQFQGQFYCCFVFVIGQQCVYVGFCQLVYGFQVDVMGSVSDQCDFVLMGIYGCMFCLWEEWLLVNDWWWSFVLVVDGWFVVLYQLVVIVVGNQFVQCYVEYWGEEQVEQGYVQYVGKYCDVGY